jgi:hypothetical protein
MKGLGLTSVLALSGSIGVFAAPVEQSTTTETVSLSQYINQPTTDSTQFHTEILTPLFPIPTSFPSPSNHSAISYSISFRNHTSGEEDVKTKTKTVTEDCSATDDVERSTTVVMVPSTQVIEYHPTVTETVTSVEVVITKSLHKPKHTKHSWTETEVETETETVESPPSTETIESPPSTVFESSKTHTKHHKSKHHKSKHHTKSSKVHSSETVETPLPTSSLSVTQTSSESSVQEVVVVTTEDVQVVTTGYEEVISTITLSESDSRLSTLTKATPTGSSSVTSSGARELFTHYNPPELVSTIPFSVYTEQMSKFRSRHTPVPEASSTESSGAKELFSHFNPEFQSTIDPSVYTSMMSKIRTRHGPVTEASSTESSSVTSSGARELFSHYNPEYTSISDPPLEPTMIPPPHETVTSSGAKELFSHFNPEYTSISDPSLEPTLIRPTHETWPFISPHGPVTPSTEDSTTTHTRSGHKTKNPPSVISVPLSHSTTVINYTMGHRDRTLTITNAPEYPSTEISAADDVLETLFARDNGDPRKKYDKYRKPDKAMSKRMSRWSKHHSHAEEKNWSYHTKYQVKSLESQMEYDESTWSKHHKTTLAAVLPAAMPSPVVNALAARDDDDDPEKDYEKKLSKANKEHDKVSSKAEAKWSKKHDKSILKSAKKYAKSLAKQSKADDKSSRKAFKSRMKEQGHDEEAYLALIERGEVTITTPKSAPAQATVTVTTVVGPAQNGTVSTSWRTRHASKTSGSLKTSESASSKTSKTGSSKTSATTSVGGGN